MSTTKGASPIESIRECETARYDELLRATCRPIGQVTSADLSVCPDPILTSLAQLATYRTATERSLISLFDKNEQYIIAEATPTTSLIPNLATGQDGDEFWLSGTHIARKDGVCDYTLRVIEDTLHETGSDELPAVIVQDLVTDPRFSSSPYCQPGTIARFYAAVPIRSPRGESQPTPYELRPAIRTFNSDSPEINHKSSVVTNPFLQAAIVIAESLQIDACMFFSGDSRELHAANSSATKTEDKNSLETSPHSPIICSGDKMKHHVAVQSLLPCQVLGSSSADSTNLSRDSALSQMFLAQLFKRYPEGCVFDFRSNQNVNFNRPPTSEDHARPDTKQDSQGFKHSRANSDDGLDELIHEKTHVLNAFPNAQTVAFTPIWDPQKGTWAIGGFMCSTKPHFEFDKDSELPFLRAIGTLAASEAFRLETSAADKAKSDILGSISHELRSPLHEHLLDFSKVNQTAQQQNPLNSVQNQSNPNGTGAGGLARPVSLDLLVEDVMESVSAGHDYQCLSMAEVFVNSKPRKHSDIRAIRQLDSMQAAEELNPTGSSNDLDQLQKRDVSVFLLYDPACSWYFHTVAGAIRRIVMNIFGNSLKYTSQGIITVSLTQSEPSIAGSQERTVTLVIEDSGRGISEEFLKNGIFKPFSQEDELSTGTGLGLSFVQKLTSQLGGRISIVSQHNVGTKVTVSLPLTLSPIQELPAEQPAEGQNTCRGLRARVVNNVKSLGHASPIVSAEDAVLETLCCDHIGMKLCTESDADRLAPDVIIVTNPTIYDLCRPAKPWRGLPVIVLCSNALVAHKYESACKLAGQTQLHDFISQPLTPLKLEKAISRVIGLWAELQDAPRMSVPMPLHSPYTPDTSATTSLPSPSETASLGKPATPATINSPFGTLTVADNYFQVPRFLLVEDNPINLKILTCFMNKLKQPYETATNGEEAVASYKANPGFFSCVLMDISMPVMDGLEATRQIRAFERYSNLSPALVLVITGLGSQSTRDEATRSGVDSYITKPAKLKELKEVLKSHGFTI
ncbi:hypothetical protein FGSG_08031 [Fusarium graminearum PH-1]|uniref:hypothetical protein n=1 Tax=Gibberella zeae (strain ATCC MYA-4620 / CBS 123657 / FGSC 9075 / NRRL 31084 / PH-1) TaxID=229533 RepID=UPI00021F14EA|nr:hypothetical protein FGSG_08031 [Fusarium graminearum PH-1]ESU15369.1 hypothetical protein FGSG_08031 [Fusarium graminearum PH-1]|eukprot:XP_011320794.1 hypothetical protein FGSG_08031 [Fusarium graminearum PH-1]